MIRSSKSSSSTQRVQGQPKLHNILPQEKEKSEVMDCAFNSRSWEAGEAVSNSEARQGYIVRLWEGRKEGGREEVKEGGGRKEGRRKSKAYWCLCNKHLHRLTPHKGDSISHRDIMHKCFRSPKVRAGFLPGFLTSIQFQGRPVLLLQGAAGGL